MYIHFSNRYFLGEKNKEYTLTCKGQMICLDKKSWLAFMQDIEGKGMEVGDKLVLLLSF